MDSFRPERNSRNADRKFNEYFLSGILSVMAANLTIIVDSIIAGRMLGEQALGAINFFNPFSQFFFALTVWLGFGASSVIARMRGKGEERDADKTYTVTLSLAVFSGLIFTALMLIFKDPLVKALMTDVSLQGPVKAYYLAYTLGKPFDLVYGCMLYFIRIDGKPHFTTVIVTVSNLINIVFDVILMGPAGLGVMGGAISTDIGIAVALSLILYHYLAGHNTIKLDFSVFREPGHAFGLLAEVLTTGLSSALNTLLVSVRHFFFNFLAIELGGAAAFSGLAMINASSIFISSFLTGAMHALIPLMGIFYGEKDYPNLRSVFYRAMAVTLGSAFLANVLIAVFPGHLVRFFGVEKAEFLKAGVDAVRVNSFSFVFMCLVTLFLNLYMVLGYKKISSTIAVLSKAALAIPSAWLLSRAFGLMGLWLSFPISQILTLVVVFLIIVYVRRKSKGRYKDFFLLDQKSEDELFSLSVTATKENASRISEYLDNAVSELTGDRKKARGVAMVSEEIVADITNRAKGTVNVDVRIVREMDGYSVWIRDDGVLYQAPESGEESAFSEVEVAKMISKSLERSNLLGFNRAVLYI